MEQGTRNMLMIASGSLNLLLIMLPVLAIISNLSKPGGITDGEFWAISTAASIIIPIPLIVASSAVFRFAYLDPNLDLQDDYSRQHIGRLLLQLGGLFEIEAFLWLFIAAVVPALWQTYAWLLVFLTVAGMASFFFIGRKLSKRGRTYIMSRKRYRKYLREQARKRELEQSEKVAW